MLGGSAACSLAACALLILLLTLGRASHNRRLTEIEGLRRSHQMSMDATLQYGAGALAAILLWAALATARPDGPTRVPSPIAVLAATRSLVASGELGDALAASLRRIATGFGLAALAGTSLGLLCGTYAVAARLLLPTNTFFRYIPPTAFVTLLILYLGIGERYKYTVVFVGVFFFIVQMTVDAVRDIERAYLEMAVVVGVTRSRILASVVVPAVAPTLIDILRINLSGAWTFLVAAEVVGNDPGLGHMINIGRRFGRVESVFVGICSFGVIGIGTDFLLRGLRNRLFRWKTLSSAR